MYSCTMCIPIWHYMYMYCACTCTWTLFTCNFILSLSDNRDAVVKSLPPFGRLYKVGVDLCHPTRGSGESRHRQTGQAINLEGRGRGREEGECVSCQVM